MPFYEYECQSCKFYSEVMQRIADPPLRKCPSCGRNTMKKLISAPNFRLKGGGWYETDFKSDKESKRNLAEADKAEKDSKPTAEAGEKAGESQTAKESKPSETKSAPEAARPRRSAAASRTPARSASVSREGGGGKSSQGTGVRRGALPTAKSASSQRGASGRPGPKAASRASKGRPARGKSRR